MYLTQWFEPEPNIVKGLPFVRALEAAGHEVTVVTAFPNYPAGRLYPGYRMRLIQHEVMEGVRVIRLPLYPSHDASSLRRSLNFLSFFVSALVYGLLRRERFDVAYVYHPPITVGLAAAFAGAVRRLPFVLDVQDLWPDTVAATGMKGAGRLVGPLKAACDFVYRRAAAIVVQAEGMGRKLVERGVTTSKITTIFNWAEAEPGEAPASGGKGPVRIVYGGNFGRAQALATVIDAAAIVERRRDDVEILLQGEGIDEAMLRERARSAGLRRLRFEGRVPRDEIIPVFAQADGLLLHLGDDPLFTVTVPSKTQFYLAMGRPIVAGVAGEAADLLRQSGAALVAPPCDAQALAQAICDLADMTPQQRAELGRAGRAFYEERLSFEVAMARTLAVLEGTYNGTRAGNRSARS